MKKYIFALALFFMVSAEQNLETKFQSILTSELDDPTRRIDPNTIAGIEEGQELLKDKCLKNGNNETYELVMEAQLEFQKCVKSLVDLEEIQEEIETAKPKGDLDMVFKKYCRKSPDLKNCIVNFTNVAEACLDEEEKGTKNALMNVTDSMINFICHKEGDRIALFMAEGGPECILSKIDAVQNCANTTFSKYGIEDGQLDVSSLPGFVLDEEKCRNFATLQSCIVKELERCTEPTPANVVESLFNFVRKSTPCAKYSPLSLGLDGKSVGSPITLSLFALVPVIFVIL